VASKLFGQAPPRCVADIQTQYGPFIAFIFFNSFLIPIFFTNGGFLLSSGLFETVVREPVVLGFQSGCFCTLNLGTDFFIFTFGFYNDDNFSSTKFPKG
jgi:hypothetical protein